MNVGNSGTGISRRKSDMAIQTSHSIFPIGIASRKTQASPSSTTLPYY
jgi:hypothetical protein